MPIFVHEQTMPRIGYSSDASPTVDRWGGMGVDHVSFQSAGNFSIRGVEISPSEYFDKSVTKSVTASAYIDKEELHGTPPRVAVRWWRNGGYWLQYKLSVRFEANTPIDMAAAVDRNVFPLPKNSYGITTVSLTRGADGNHNPDHFTLEPPRDAVVREVMVLAPYRAHLRVSMTIPGQVMRAAEIRGSTFYGAFKGLPVFGLWEISPTEDELPPQLSLRISWEDPQP